MGVLMKPMDLAWSLLKADPKTSMVQTASQHRGRRSQTMHPAIMGRMVGNERRPVPMKDIESQGLDTEYHPRYGPKALGLPTRDNRVTPFHKPIQHTPMGNPDNVQMLPGNVMQQM
jgi:hypothetical protein